VAFRPPDAESWVPLIALLQSAAREEPSQTWLTFVGGEELTFDRVWRRSKATAAALSGLGVQTGDRVGIFMGNRPEFLFAWFASRLIGAIAVPMNTAAKGPVLEHYLSITQPRVVLVDELHADRVNAAAPAIAPVPVVLSVSETAWQQLIRANDGTTESAEPTAGQGPQDPAAILFTSGTTGPSKGVTFSERFLVNFARLGRDVMGYQPSDVVYTCLPLFHANALLIATCATLLVRARIAISPKFSVRRYWRELAESRATVTSQLGAMASLLLQQEPSPQERNHGVNRAHVVPATADIYSRVEQRFGIAPIDVYGTTDIGIPISNRWGDHRRPGSCGRVMDGYECVLVNSDDVPVPEGKVGELLVRPTRAGMMSDGYWRMPEATVNAWRGLWFRTGDLLRQDVDGWYYFIDRRTDAIRRRGENVSSYEVEHVFLMHPDVVEAAAYPLPSELTEDEVAVSVVLRPTSTVSPEDLVRFANSYLAYYALPRYVTITKALPKTPTQKVQKQVLIQRGVTKSTWDAVHAGFKPSR
jgi:crotonobetaine/carnitine-CoA ligase